MREAQQHCEAKVNAAKELCRECGGFWQDCAVTPGSQPQERSRGPERGGGSGSSGGLTGGAGGAAKGGKGKSGPGSQVSRGGGGGKGDASANDGVGRDPKVARAEHILHSAIAAFGADWSGLGSLREAVAQARRDSAGEGRLA